MSGLRTHSRDGAMAARGLAVRAGALHDPARRREGRTPRPARGRSGLWGGGLDAWRSPAASASCSRRGRWRRVRARTTGEATGWVARRSCSRLRSRRGRRAAALVGGRPNARTTALIAGMTHRSYRYYCLSGLPTLMLFRAGVRTNYPDPGARFVASDVASSVQKTRRPRHSYVFPLQRSPVD